MLLDNTAPFWWNKHLIFFFYFNPLLPTHSPRSPCIVKHFCSPSPFTRDKPATAVASVVQPDSPAGRLSCSSYIWPLYAERRYESCTDISRVMQAFWLPSGFGRAAVGVRGGDWVTGPSSSWQPPKGEFQERRRTFCSLAKSFRSGRGRRASLDNNCSHTKAVDERLTQDLGSAEIFRDR